MIVWACCLKWCSADDTLAHLPMCCAVVYGVQASKRRCESIEEASDQQELKSAASFPHGKTSRHCVAFAVLCAVSL